MKVPFPRLHIDSPLLLICLTLEPFCVASAGDLPERGGRSFEKVSTNDQYQAFLINNVFNYYGNNGSGSFNKLSTNDEGFEFPKGTGKHTTFQDGMLWSGYHKGWATPKVGGSYFRHSLQAGRIVVRGTPTSPPSADNPSLQRYRIYRVRPHVNPHTPFNGSMDQALEVEEAALISRYESVSAQSVYDQYVQDWVEWPAAEGAPYLDVDGNGSYSPMTDVPGVPGADQTLWYAANDMDSARIAAFSGSPPIGMQVQKTIWGYKRSGALGNTIFIATRFINLSGAPVDSMFIGFFADVDLGEPEEDLSGCDTLRDMSYVYNGPSYDRVYGVSVPAVGFALLQGPCVKGGISDTAWLSGSRKPGFRNLRLSSAIPVAHGIVQYRDPVMGAYHELNNLLRGLTVFGLPFRDPADGRASPFPLSGDPVTGSGWTSDRMSLPPTDIRVLFATGPFTFGDGDTQEVVIAHTVGRGADRLSSITELRRTVDSLRSHLRMLPRLPAPDIRCTADQTAYASVTLRVIADGRFADPAALAVVLRRPGGAEAVRVQLNDDGSHGDGAAGDRVYGESVTFPREPDPFAMAGLVSPNSAASGYEIPLGSLITAGPLAVGPPTIFSDNFNDDGSANPGEEVRFGLTFHNAGSISLTNITVTAGWQTTGIASLAPGATYSMVYDPNDPHTFFAFRLPSGGGFSQQQYSFSASDDKGNVWNADVVLPVAPISFDPQWRTLARTAGKADGEFRLLIVDPSQFRAHRYAVTGVDSIDPDGSNGITIVDSTDGRILLSNHPLPDDNGHTMSLTDGFKIVRGTTRLHSGTAVSWNVPRGVRHWSISSLQNLLGLEGFSGNIGNAFDHWPSGGVPYDRQHSILITYAGTDTNGVPTSSTDPYPSFAYRYLQNADQPPARPEFTPLIKNPGPGFAYQDYVRGLPFMVFDVDVTPPRRLMVGFLENNVAGGRVDGKYWPPSYQSNVNNCSPTGPREWFFIFDAPYAETPDPRLQVDIWQSSVALMWVGYPRWLGPGPFVAGNEFNIVAGKAPGAGDRWSFTLNHDDFLPSSNSLAQNYPNPFNPGTIIRYTLPFPSRVTLAIYNILGQRVRTLVDGPQYAGEFSIPWEGNNDDGKKVASGVYIYRLESSVLSAPSSTFVESKKMLLLR